MKKGIKRETKSYLYKKTRDALEKRGVDLKELSKLVVKSQIKHSPEITDEAALENIKMVLKKREVQYAVLTGIELDILAENKKLSEPISDIIERDEGLYGIDEALAASIVNCYGGIALTNYGFLDIAKPGIIGTLDNDTKDGKVNTFLDDIACALVAAACSRYAHNQADKRE